ncbi:MAG: hypothetical protein N2A99_04085 [Carnobacterium alterfunditum]
MKKFLVVLMFFFSLTLMIPQTSFADKGDFYDDNKDEFDKANLPDDYIDTMKDYDYDTNSFDCGMTAISCKMIAFQSGWGTGLAKFAAKAVQGTLMNPEEITKEDTFERFKGYLQGLSSGMLALFLIWQVMVMMMRRFGDPDDYSQAMNTKLLQVFVAGAMLTLYEKMFEIILTLQNDATSAVLQSGVDEERLVLMVLLYSPNYSIFFGMAMALIYIVFAIAILYRFIALGFFYVVGPIAIPTIVNEEFNYFQLWLKFIVNNVVTLFLQSLAFSLAVAAMTNQFAFTQEFSSGLDVIMGFLLAIVLMFFALVIPSILGNMGSSTGTGRMVGKVARYALMKK